MQQIEGLYDHISFHLAKQCVVGGIVNCVEPNISGLYYTSLYSSTNQFTYDVVYHDSAYQQALKSYANAPTGICAAIKDICGITTDCKDTYARTVNFGNMASIQHLIAYIDQFGIQNVVTVITANQQPGPAPTTYSSIYCNSPLFYNCPGRWSYCNLEESLEK